jgi:hypothetical protein
MMFEPVSAGQTICGTSWAAASSRDTDWYLFTADHAVTITMTGKAEFPYALYVIDPGYIDSCGDEAVIAAGNSVPCSTNTVSVSVPAGTWYLWAGPSVYDGLPCGGTGTYTNDYYFSLTTTPVWLTLGLGVGTILPGGDPVKVPVLMDGFGLAAGTYTGNVLFETNDPLNASVQVPVTFTISSAPDCEYLIGDFSGDGNRMGADVTFGVRYFKGLGATMPDSCANDSVNTTRGHWLYVAADCNGDCNQSGADITRLVAYFKGTAHLSCCRFFPTTLPPILRETPSPFINKDAAKID